MSKIIKNTTGTARIINDTGVTIPASDQYTIPPQDYLLWAASTDITALVNAGTLVVNDGSVDLSAASGLAHLGDGLAQEIRFDNSTNGFPAGATNVQRAIELLPSFDPQSLAQVNFDDFDNRMGWSPATVGVGSSASVSQGNTTMASGKHVGVARVATGTPIGTSAALNWSATLANSIVLGNGTAEYQTLIYLPLLATALNPYIIRVGLGTSTSADHANGVYFEYSNSNANWILKTALNSTRTTVTSTIPVVAATWTHLRWTCNAAGTNVDFYVQGVLAGSITTNIPTTTGQGCGGNFQISNPTLALQAAREMFMDYFYFYKTYTARD